MGGEGEMILHGCNLATCANMCYGFDGFVIRVIHGLMR